MNFGAGPLPFIVCFALGAGLGIIYKIFQILVRKIKYGKIIKNIFGFLFVLLTAFLYFILCFYTLEGQFRIFTLVALFLGLGTSFISVSFIKKWLFKHKQKR